MTAPPVVRPSGKVLRGRSVLPGVRVTLGFTLAYLIFLVIIPLSTLFVRSGRMGWGPFWDAALSPRAMAAYKLSVGASVTAALVNCRSRCPRRWRGWHSRRYTRRTD
jgi:ABC-type sulfate transport system permease component